MAELEAREAAAQARAEALRARIAELTEQLTVEEELCSRLGVTRRTVLEILGGGDDSGWGAVEGVDGRPGGVEQDGDGAVRAARCAWTARSHVPPWRRPLRLRGWVSGWSRWRCGSRAWRRRCCQWPTVTCWKCSRMRGSRCGPGRSPRRWAGRAAPQCGGAALEAQAAGAARLAGRARGGSVCPPRRPWGRVRIASSRRASRRIDRGRRWS